MIGIGIGSSKNKLSKVSYSQMAQEYFDEVATQPDSSNKSLYNTLFVDGATIMGLSDRFFINGAQYEDNALTSLKNPTSTPKSKISTPAWVQYQGYSGDTGKALNWNFIPSTDAVQFTQNSGTLWIWSNTNTDGLYIDIGGGNFSATVSSIWAKNGGDLNGFINDITGTAATIPNSLGLIAVVRPNATTIQVWQNGIKIFEAASNSTSLTAMTLYECAINNNGVFAFPSPRQIFASGIGSGSINQLDLYNLLFNFKSGLP